MKAVSLFSGVGGMDMGFERAGVQTVLQAEIDPWALGVLARHWPDVERVSDVRDVHDSWATAREGRRGDVGGGGSEPDAGRLESPARSATDIGVVYGGFPCQPFSVAGKRAGDRDDRNLWPEFRRVLSELRPRWAVAENVPGLLSIDGGRYFGTILNDLAGLGFDASWAVLDAQHFGVPQRRRRLFVVAGADAHACEQILALCESCGGHSQACGEAGQRLADSLTVGANQTSGFNGDFVEQEITANTLLKGGHGNNPLDETLLIDNATYPLARRGRDGGLAFELGEAELSNALRSADGGSSRQPEVLSPMGVRRLSPLECERLQGWPDDWTRYTADGREITDSVRYRLIGNGVVSTVAEWIARRLVVVDGCTK